MAERLFCTQQVAGSIPCQRLQRIYMEAQLDLFETPAEESLTIHRSFEGVVRTMISTREDTPDWMYMKAIELSRAADEAHDSNLLPEYVVLNLIFSQLALERRVHMLEVAILEFKRWSKSVEKRIRTF
jgi:hypothetical protein